MSKNLKWIAVILALLIGIVILFQRSCHVTDELSFYKGLFSAYQAKAEAADLEAKQIIAEKEKSNASLVKENVELKKDSSAIAGKITAKDKAIAALEEERKGLKDLPAIIVNQDKTIAELKITLAWEREDKAKIQTWGNNYKLAYENQITISDEWKKKADREEQLKNLSLDISGKKDRQIQKLRLFGNVKTVAIVAAAAYLGYGLVKGK